MVQRGKIKDSKGLLAMAYKKITYAFLMGICLCVWMFKLNPSPFVGDVCICTASSPSLDVLSLQQYPVDSLL